MAGRQSHNYEITPLSLARAKDLLGADGKNLSDDDIRRLIINLENIASSYIHSVPKSKTYNSLSDENGS